MAQERYRRLRLLGQGMTSHVWLARDTSTQQFVALKIMRAVLGNKKLNSKVYERFLREIAIGRKLHHPHILPVLDSGYMRYEQRTVPFLVCPYIEEGSLAHLIQQTPPWQYWSLAQTTDAITQAAESLWHLHTQAPQIVHQDVKPGNFLYRSLQEPQRAVYLYLCDFGISRQQQREALTTTELVGTFAYMAPEQIERKVHRASDQYALAVMACYLLTGKLPWQVASGEQYVRAHLYELPTPPGRLYPQRITSSEVDAVIMQALEKDPEQRFPTIMDFAEALHLAVVNMEQRSGLVRGTTLGKEIEKDTASFPLVSPANIEAPLALDPPEDAADQVLDEPLLIPPIADKPDKPMTLPTFPLQPLTQYSLPSRPKMLYWSPNGNALACVLYGHPPVHLDLEDGMEAIRIQGADQTTCVCWSPDGHVLAVSVRGTVHFWNVQEGRELPLVLPFDVHTIEGLDWSIRGELAVWIRDRVLLYPLSALPLEQKQMAPTRQIMTGNLRCNAIGLLRWSPDGSRLVAGASNGRILCWSMHDGDNVWQVTEPGRKVMSLVWIQDASLLLAAFSNNCLRGWNAHLQECVLLWETLPVMPRFVDIAAHGLIVVASREPRLLLGNAADEMPVAQFPGQLLAAWSPGRIKLATLDIRQETRLTLWHL